MIAIYGRTASGKSAVARALLDPARRRGRVGLGSPRRSTRELAARWCPARLVGRPRDERRVGRRITAPRARGDRRESQWPAAPASLGPRRSLGSPAAARRARSAGRRCTTPIPTRPMRCSPSATPPGPRASTRRRPARRARARTGRRRLALARPAAGLPLAGRHAPSTTLVGLELDADELAPAHSTAAVRTQVADGVVRQRGDGCVGPAALGHGEEGARPRGVRDAPGSTRPSSPRRAVVARTHAVCRLPVAATLDAARPPEQLADEICALAGTGNVTSSLRRSR